MQGSPINWNTNIGNKKLLQSQYYLYYSRFTFAQVSDKKSEIIADIKKAEAGIESAEVIAYLSWLLRVIALMA